MIEVKDEVSIDVVKFEPTKGSEFTVDLEKFLTYNGGVVNAKVSGSDKAGLSGHRKTSSEGLYKGSSVQMIDMYSSGKWSLFYFKDGETFKTDWEYDAGRNDVSLPADQKVTENIVPLSGAVNGMAHVQSAAPEWPICAVRQ